MAKYFQLLLYAMTDFEGLKADDGPALATVLTDSPEPSYDDFRFEEDHVAIDGDDQVLFVSHLIIAYVRRQLMQMPEDERECLSAEEKVEVANLAIEDLWNSILADSNALSSVRRSLGLAESSQTATAAKTTEMLFFLGISNLPVDIVGRTFAIAARASETADLKDVEINREAFVSIAKVCMAGGARRARCAECGVLWAAIWALASEREHEVELMGQLFELFDTSGDGYLQFEEFWEFLNLVAPEMSQADAEDIFLCGAEDVSDGMTRDVFLGLVNRFRLSTNVDTLEHLLTTKRATMYGELG